MKNLLIGILIGVAIGGIFYAVSAIADPSWIGIEAIYNRVFDSTTNSLNVIGV